MRKLLGFLGIFGVVVLVGVGFLGCKDAEDELTLTGKVIITGNAQVSQTLTADISALSGNGNISYQWKQDGEIIIGSDNKYIVQTTDIDTVITVTVTRAGIRGSITSAPTAKVVDLVAPTLGLAFTLINNGTAYSVSKGTASASDVVIPAIHEGLPVIEIADSGFSSYENLESVVIPIGVTRIGNYAFFHNDSLICVTIPAGITNIGNFAFNECNSLAMIYYFGTSSGWNSIAVGTNNLPITNAVLFYYSETDPGTENTHWRYVSGFQEIWGSTPGLVYRLLNNNTGYSVSKGTATSNSVVIPAYYAGKYVTMIGALGFSNYQNMTSITIPNSVTSIGESAFSECTSLTSISIPNSVTSIGRGTFNGCINLTEITIPFVGNSLNGSSNTHFGFIFGAPPPRDYNQNNIPASLQTVIITRLSKIYKMTPNKE